MTDQHIKYQIHNDSGNTDVYQVLDLAAKAGEVLLENGAEIHRVEETMQRIAAHFGVKNEEFFVLSNGIFTTGDDEDHDKVFAKVRFIPMKGTQFYKIVLVNQLSRDIEAGKYTVEEAAACLEEIREKPGKSKLWQILASGLGAGGFCILYGGSVFDSVAALITGILLYTFMIFVAFPHFSKIVSNLSGGALVTVICMLLIKMGIGQDLSHMIIGSIVPLIPGVAFTNGVRDIANEDYISGMVRLLDAILGFLCIAIGVGAIYVIYRHLFGGAL